MPKKFTKKFITRETMNLACQWLTFWAQGTLTFPNLHQQKADQERSAAPGRAGSPKPHSAVAKEAGGQGGSSEETKPAILEVRKDPEAVRCAGPENYSRLLSGQSSLKVLASTTCFTKKTIRVILFLLHH